MKKRTIILSASAVIILALAIGISIKLSGNPTIAESTAEPTPQASQEAVIVDIKNEEGSATPEISAEQTPAPEQAIPQVQENVPAPTKPTKKPDPPKATGSYTNSNSPPAYSEKDTVKEPAKQTPQPQKENSQQTKGKYVEGFGYVEYEGPAEGKTVDSNGDINKQVGNMD